MPCCASDHSRNSPAAAVRSPSISKNTSFLAGTKYELWLKERIAAYRENGPSDPPLSIEVGPIEFLHDPVESEEHSLKVKDGLLA